MDANTENGTRNSDRGVGAMGTHQAQSTTAKACQHVAEILAEITDQVWMDLRLKQVLVDLSVVCVTAIAKDAGGGAA